MRKIKFFCLLVCLCLCGCGEQGSGRVKGTNESTYEVYADGSVIFKGGAVINQIQTETVNTKDGKMVKISLTYTNHSETTQSFDSAFVCTALQAGTKLEGSDNEYTLDKENQETNITPGSTTDIVLFYKLKDQTTVTLEIAEKASAGSDYYSYDFEVQ